MVTQKDVSQRAGVNISTVSKVFNGSKDISVETREKVLRISHELNYIHKSKADSNNLIGILCPEIKSNYYARFLTQIISDFEQEGYLPILGISEFDYEQEQFIVSEFHKRNVCGIICLTENNQIEKDLLYHKSINSKPFLLIAHEITSQESDYLKVDIGLGILKAIEHLIELGHKEIGFIGDNQKCINNKKNVFIEILKKKNLVVDESFIKIGDERFEKGGYLRMKEILNAPKKPTAIIAAYDNIAIGTYKAIYEADFKVPEDISIVGMDDIMTAAFMPVSLTSITDHITEMADIASSVLVRKIKDKNFKMVQHTVIKPDLIVRSSTGIVPSSMP